MRLVIEMDVDNAAFVEHGGDEIRRVLNEMCDRMPQTPIDWGVSHRVTPKCVLTLRDSNGNEVGKARFVTPRGKRR